MGSSNEVKFRNCPYTNLLTSQNVSRLWRPVDVTHVCHMVPMITESLSVDHCLCTCTIATSNNTAWWPHTYVLGVIECRYGDSACLPGQEHPEDEDDALDGIEDELCILVIGGGTLLHCVLDQVVWVLRLHLQSSKQTGIVPALA